MLTGLVIILSMAVHDVKGEDYYIKAKINPYDAGTEFTGDIKKLDVRFACRPVGTTEYKDVAAIPSDGTTVGFIWKGNEGDVIECTGYGKYEDVDNNSKGRSGYGTPAQLTLNQPVPTRIEITVTDIGSLYYVVCCDPTGAIISKEKSQQEAGIVAGNAARKYKYTVDVKRTYHMQYTAIEVTQ